MIACTVLEEVHDLTPFSDCNITLNIYTSLAKINSAYNLKTVFLDSMKRIAKTKQDVSLLMQSTCQCLESCQMKIIKDY